MEELFFYISDCIIPRNGIIFENLPDAYLIQILFTFFFGTQRLITTLKTACDCTLF